MIFAVILSAALELLGVTGEDLRARSFFDANNVKVGDPMVLTVDFLGSADFAALHPPRLAGAVDGADWKVDQASAKTDTFKLAGNFFTPERAVGRRLTYRVRPIRAGVLTWPTLDFSYRTASGEKRICRANAIPVHAVPGEKVEVKLDDTEQGSYPPFVCPACLGPDEAFALKRAFTQGNYAAVYEALSTLAWRKGQTPEIEAALLAARARRYSNPYIELPIWRLAGRPLLRYPLMQQVLIAAGILVGVVLLLLVLSWTIRRLAVVALALLLVLPVAAATKRSAFDPFGFSFSFGGEPQEKPQVQARVALSKPAPQVGEVFELLFSVTSSTNAQVQIQNLKPRVEIPGFAQAGESRRRADGVLVLPVRVDVPFNGMVSFQVSGMVSMTSRTRNSSFSFSNSFAADTSSVALEVRPLDPAGQPADFSGIVAEAVDFAQTADLTRVATNDVVTLSFGIKLPKGGYVPETWQPEGAACWWGQNLWRGWFVADGSAHTPDRTLCFYNPKTKTYEHATARGGALTYHE